MVNFNGTITEYTQTHLADNRAFLYGDAVFETIKSLDGKILFLEDHYFRLMSSMRILRMEIPMYFTMEFLEEEIQKTIAAHPQEATSYRIRITCFRIGKGKYTPDNRNIEYLITTEPLTEALYSITDQAYEIEIFKDFHVSKHLLSTIKSTNRLINITAGIFAEENDYANVLLINEDKNVVEAIHGNVFVVSGNQIATPPISDGCIQGIMRKKIKAIVEKWEEYEWIERSISPFELQKADEIWISNVIMGVQPVTKYRKKEYRADVAKQLVTRLNSVIRLD